MQSRIKNAMLLAAGYGTRLKPLTDHTPKPLVPVAGRPMIEYLKAQLVDYFAAEKNLRVTISEEVEPLETGGGLKKAAPFLGDEPVFAINSDILWTDEGDTALNRLTRQWDDAKMDFLLLAQSKARAVGHDKGEDHLFIKPENTFNWDAAAAPYIITGIGIFHPRVLRDAPEGKFSVKALWLRAMAQNRLFCLPHHGHWFQTGTLADIQKTETRLKRL